MRKRLEQTIHSLSLAPGERQSDHTKQNRNHERVASVRVWIKHDQASGISSEPRGKKHE